MDELHGMGNTKNGEHGKCSVRGIPRRKFQAFAKEMIKIMKCFPLIGAIPWVGAIVSIIISVAIIPWSEIEDAPPLGVMVMWGQIIIVCNLLALLIVLAGIIETWRCIRLNAPCGLVLVGMVIALMMPLVFTLFKLLK